MVPLQVALLIYNARRNMLWLVSSLEELMESLALSREIADLNGTSFLIAREEFEIILPGMSE